jgi:poly(3-hydroxybutyrate) depolymerase
MRGLRVLALLSLAVGASSAPLKQVPARSGAQAVGPSARAAAPSSVALPKTVFAPSAAGSPAIAAGAKAVATAAPAPGLDPALRTLGVMAEAGPARAAWDGLSRRDDARLALPGSPAFELRAARLAQYSESRAAPVFPPRTPLSDYFIHFTAKSQSVQRFWRDAWLQPSLAAWSLVPGIFGDGARQGLKALEFIARVEANPPEWTTENRVLLEEPTYSLRDFTASTRWPVDPAKTPILVIPPNSGHYSTIADFAENKSIVQTALKSGHPTYAIDWKDATSGNPQLYDDMVQDALRAVERLGGKVILVGLCQGGVTAVALAAKYPRLVEALALAGAPIDATRGDNAVTRISKQPMELFRWFVHGIGKPEIYDGTTQLEGFLNMGEGKRQRLFKTLLDNAADAAWVKDALPFWRWFFHTRDLSGAWFLQAVERLFKKNELFEGRFELQTGAELTRLDLTKLDMPVFLMEGTKDDVTPPAVIDKGQLAGVVADVEGAWRFLNRAGFIADRGEDGMNREEGKRAVIEPKTFATSLRGFALKNDPFVKRAAAAEVRALYELVRSRKGQTLALSEKIATPKRDRFLATFNGGHIGLYNSAAVQDVWADAFARLRKAAARRR